MLLLGSRRWSGVANRTRICMRRSRAMRYKIQNERAQSPQISDPLLSNVFTECSVQTSSKSSEAAREAGLLATRHQGPFVLYFSPHCHGSAREACMVEFFHCNCMKANRPLGLNDDLINVQKRICSFLHFLLFVTTRVRPASMLTMVLPFTARPWPWPMPSTRRTGTEQGSLAVDIRYYGG